MKTRVLKNIIVAALVISGVAAMAQCKTPEWPADKAKAEECLAIYGDAVKAGNFNEAKKPLLWLVNNAPKVNRQIYIEGADMYDKFATSEKDAAKKQVLVDSMLIMYDLRIASCGEEAVVLNRKANASFKHNYKNKEKLPTLLKDFDKVFEL